MRRDLERRVARAETAAHALDGADAQAVHRRCSLRAMVKVCDIIRNRLVAMGIEPALAVSLRRGEEAAAELLTIHDTPEPRVADAAATKRDLSGRGNGLDSKLATIAGPMVEQFGRGEEPIDFGNASLVELMAFVTAFGPVAR
jgi:hypothetical protein